MPKWKQAKPLVSEVVPEGDLVDLVPYLEEEGAAIEGTTSAEEARRFHSYTLEEGESQVDFSIRKILDIVSCFYEFERSTLASPFSASPGAPPITGIMLSMHSGAPNYAPVIVTMDFPNNLFVETEARDSQSACRIALFSSTEPLSGNILVPDIQKNLASFFDVLPRSCGFKPWEKNPTSTEHFFIYDSYMLAPNDLFAHFAADILVRLCAWLYQEHAYELDNLS